MIFNVRSRKYVAREPKTASGFFLRLAGLMGRTAFPRGCDALIFPRCSAIHCCFMRMKIDVLFTDDGGRVLRCVSNAAPWRFFFGGRGAVTTVELPAGTIAESGTEEGDVLNFNSELTPESVEKLSRGVSYQQEPAGLARAQIHQESR